MTRSPATVMIDAKPIPSTEKVVAIFSPGHGRREHDGAVTVVDPRGGPDRKGYARAITTAAGVDSGLKVDVGDSVMPTLGFTYFLTDHLAVEAILGTTKHEIRAQGGATDVAVHETWVLPPVVTLQYRPLTEGRFSPYVGAGVNYMLFYSGEDKNGFKVDLDDNFGYALQAGADIGIQGPWNLNVDVKKVWVNIDADVNDGALKSDVDLDPWVVSVGVGRKF